MGVIASCFAVTSATGYNIQNRWTTTATDGGGHSLGDPLTLLWSVAPDGTVWEGDGGNGSDVIEYLDDGWNVAALDRTADLTNRPWWDWMDRVYKQYSRVSGLTMEYVTDDGLPIGWGGAIGQRGDIRIGGRNIDSNIVGTLAHNAFPNNGEMTIDTFRDAQGIPSWWHSSFAPDQFRNLIAHESGHGTGLNHEILTGVDAVMEVPLESTFWALQFDEVYALNRLYGDPLEKNGGNDFISSATHLGVFGTDSTVTLGADAGDAVVDEIDGDWLGIDGDSDSDWFRFSVTDTTWANITVAPLGPTYVSGQQGTFVASAQSDLNLQLFGPNGTNLLASIDQQGIGNTEVLERFELTVAGEYFLHVGGESDLNQFYQLDVLVTTFNGVEGDVNQDGSVDEADITAFQAGWLSDTSGMTLVESIMLGDLNASGRTDQEDVFILREALKANLANLDLDGLPADPVPEPSTLALCMVLSLLIFYRQQMPTS